MLQDRGVMRLISAPHGFGKSALASEYATRLFAGKDVCWIDAGQPDFLAALDEKRLLGAFPKGERARDLIVIDDMPWLHEQRARNFTDLVDEALMKGAEIVVTTLPSADFLHETQPDCLYIGASDLLVGEDELAEGHVAPLRERKARAARGIKQAGRVFMGRVPAVAWGSDARAETERCLRGFFDERLDVSTFRYVLSVLLLGKGTFGELEHLGVALGTGDCGVLARDYPFLGLDVNKGTFDIGELPLEVLAEALEGTECAVHLLGGAVPLAERVLAVLFDRGDMQRAAQALSLFCPDRHCAAWLVSRGWELLDQGQIQMVEELFSRCSADEFVEVPRLWALKAWTYGLQGDEFEACRLAQQVIDARGAQRSARDDGVARLASYLALEAFGSGATVVYGKETYATADALTSPEEFLARVVDLCTSAEIGRALCADGSDRQTALEKSRQSAQERRVRALTALFTEHHDRFQGCLAYRLALHFLEYVDSSEIRQLLRVLGCDVIIAMRREGLRSYTEALLVRDLWKNGYFGVGAAGGGQRDVVLLDAASRMLKALAKSRKGSGADVPWEVKGHLYRELAQSDVQGYARSETDIMHVRLFGCFEVTVGERLIRDADFRKKSRLLLTLLVTNQGRDMSRDTLLEALWPESARLRALDSFYTVWSNLVAAIGDGPYLERIGDFCRVNTRYVVSDVGEFEQLCRQLLVSHPQPRELLDIYARLESLYHGDLLPSEVGNKLVDAQRERYKALFADSMVAASSCALDVGDARLALWFARKGLDADNHREDTYYALMGAQIAAGQRCSAIRTYFECRKFLDDELGLDPSFETKELYERLISIDPSLLKLDPKTFAL